MNDTSTGRLTNFVSSPDLMTLYFTIRSGLGWYTAYINYLPKRHD